MARGIDYGMGQSNIDRTNGIRYGVISMNDLAHWAWENFESDYGDPTCPSCGGGVVEYDASHHGEYDGGSDYACHDCMLGFDSSDAYGDEPLCHELDDGEYKAEVGGDDNDCFVVKSPYYTRAAFCSPCAPGAGHLSSPCTDGEKTYCFGKEWFEKNNPCIYPIWRVDDDTLVYPPTKEGLALMLAALDGDTVAEQAFQDYLQEQEIY